MQNAGPSGAGGAAPHRSPPVQAGRGLENENKKPGVPDPGMRDDSWETKQNATFEHFDVVGEVRYQPLLRGERVSASAFPATVAAYNTYVGVRYSLPGIS